MATLDSSESGDPDLFEGSWSLPEPQRHDPRVRRLLASSVVVLVYSVVAAGALGTVLDVWPYRLDGPASRDLAEAFLWPVGEPIAQVVDLIRAAVDILTLSDATAVVVTWPFAFVLCGVVAFAQATLIVATANLLYAVIRRVAVHRRSATALAQPELRAEPVRGEEPRP
ncbi:MAG TPA: hypothetical protein VL294_04555 [Pseudolysinimonas sp.]|jgi:hypothetical protein|nr:hypothetical protein [Pseudolysinimonas sp.]